MDRHRLLPALCLSAYLGATACLDRDAPPPSGNLLSLDLGGNHPSLAEDQRRTAPAPKLKPQPVPAAIAPAAIEPPTPRRRVAPRPEYLVVYIAEGQTLYGICKSNLGNGNRWREVARLNGWSDERAGRLPVGQAVKLPLR